MSEVLLVIAILAVVAIVGVLVYAATKPNTFRVERAISVNAPPERIFAFLSDFHNWPTWSPWEKMDPAMARTYSGAPTGVGAAYAWDGNKKVGAGRMEIVEASPPTRLGLKLDFSRPFEAHNRVDFTLIPEGQATRVVWAMSGPAPYIAKVMGVVMNMDRMVGKDFERGLANLKAAAERPAPATA
jgi:uncharacterized protein YndB with AHSA1/START domain